MRPPAAAERHRWRVATDDAGERLDRHIAARLEIPRNRVLGWLRQGAVSIEGAAAKPSRIVSEGELITLTVPSPSDGAALTAEPGELTVLFEDSALVVLDKAAGLAVHPGAGRADGTLANRLLHRYPEIERVGSPGRPGIVHRLDIGTTGVMLIARTDAAYLALSRAFAERRVDKRYLAIVHGRPSPEYGTVDQPIGRDARDRKRMAVRDDGRPATSHYRTLASTDDRRLSILDIDLATGRTHQARVHARAIGHPLVGDPTYGEARWRALVPAQRAPIRDFPRPALHAWRLAIDHPIDGQRLEFEAPVPDDLLTLWRQVAGSDWPTAD